MKPNRSIDTDVLSAGFARLLAAGHLQRQAGNMGIVTTVIDALRRLGSPTQKSAIERQDEQLKGKRIVDRRRHVARSELGQTSVFVATTEPEPETVISKRIPLGECGFFKPIYISLQDAAEREWRPIDAA